jgi:hypothetical protein
VLAMSTMFTRDIYAHYGGREKYGEKAAVHFARAFILIVTVIAYLVALYLKEKQGIFEIAIRFAFSGFAAMSPVMIAALFWKRSTKWGALASTLFVAATLIGFALMQGKPTPPPAAKPPLASAQQTNAVAKVAAASMGTNAGDVVKTPTPVMQTNAMTNVAATTTGTNASDVVKPVAETKPAVPTAPAGAAVAPAKPKVDVIWQVGDRIILSRAPPTGDVRFWNATGTPTGGYMTVVPMVFGSALCMIIFSLLTRPPRKETVDKYFPKA